MTGSAGDDGYARGGGASHGHLLLTGGSRGIGAAIATHAMAQGYVVTDVSRTPVPGPPAGRGGDRRRHRIALDVVAPGAAETALAQATDALGPVTAFVANAGVTGPLGRLADTPPEALQRTVDVNLTSVLLWSRVLVRYWRAAGIPGVLITVGSVAARTGAPGEYVGYAATKAAIEAFTVGLGREVADDGIRVVCVSPGTTRTGIHAAAGDPARPERIAAQTPLRRVAEPDEVAKVVLFALSERASAVTAAVLPVTGGA